MKWKWKGFFLPLPPPWADTPAEDKVVFIDFFQSKKSLSLLYVFLFKWKPKIDTASLIDLIWKLFGIFRN